MAGHLLVLVAVEAWSTFRCSLTVHDHLAATAASAVEIKVTPWRSPAPRPGVWSNVGPALEVLPSPSSASVQVRRGPHRDHAAEPYWLRRYHDAGQVVLFDMPSGSGTYTFNSFFVPVVVLLVANALVPALRVVLVWATLAVVAVD